MKNIQIVAIGKLKPYENNPRINKDAVDKVAASLKEFGWQQPIVVDKDYVVIAGHTRLKAAKRLDMKEVPVVIADDLTEEQVKAYRLADNKTNEFSTWDDDKLAAEIAGILDINMEMFGFDMSEFEDQPEVVEDDYEPVMPEVPKAQRGDIYRLGRHRLMAGDSTSREDMSALTNGAEIDMMITDPPYNVDIEETAGKIMNDNMESGAFREFLRKAFETARSVLKPGAAFHIWYGENEAYNFRGACADAGLIIRQQLIWVKSQATLGRQDFQHQYESVLTGDVIGPEEEPGYQPCLYGWKDGQAHKWYKKRKERDVLFFDKPLKSAEHPTMKPILLFDYEMQCNTRKGDSVLDMFAGSGTTIMAAEQNGRAAYCMELDPKYVDVIIDRWERFTGGKAELIQEGRGVDVS